MGMNHLRNLDFARQLSVKAIIVFKLAIIQFMIGDPVLARASSLIEFAPLPTTQPMARHDSKFRDWSVLRGQSGYWQLGKDRQGVWWFISPEGKMEFLNLVTGINPFQNGRAGDNFVATTWASDEEQWAESEASRVLSYGFKGSGSWSHRALHKTSLPMSRDLNVLAYVVPWSLRWDVFSPVWEAQIEKIIAKQVRMLRNNQNLIGYFIDNELDWWDYAMAPANFFDGRPTTDPMRRRVLSLLQSLWPNVNNLNEQLHTQFKSWNDLKNSRELPPAILKSPGYNTLLTKWRGLISRRYHERTTALIRKHDPNHLILGSRYASYISSDVVRGSRGLTDAQSINIFTGDGRVDKGLFEMIHQESNQPIVISEYTFHSLNNRTGNDPDQYTIGGRVYSQASRAFAYKVFTERLASLPYVVSSDWFQWNDEPASGRGDGENLNVGVVDIRDVPYMDLVESVRGVNGRVNGIHAKNRVNQDVWKKHAPKRKSLSIPALATEHQTPQCHSREIAPPNSLVLPLLKRWSSLDVSSSRLRWRMPNPTVALALSQNRKSLLIWGELPVTSHAPGRLRRFDEFRDRVDIKLFALEPSGVAQMSQFSMIPQLNGDSYFNIHMGPGGGSWDMAEQNSWSCRTDRGYRFFLDIPLKLVSGLARGPNQIGFDIQVHSHVAAEDFFYQSHSERQPTRELMRYGIFSLPNNRIEN